MLKFKYNVMFERVLDTFEMHPGYVRYAYEMLLGCSKTIAIYYYYFTFFCCVLDASEMRTGHGPDAKETHPRHVCDASETCLQHVRTSHFTWAVQYNDHGTEPVLQTSVSSPYESEEEDNPSTLKSFNSYLTCHNLSIRNVHASYSMVVLYIGIMEVRDFKHPKTSLIFTLWHLGSIRRLCIAKLKNVFGSFLTHSKKLLQNFENSI